MPPPDMPTKDAKRAADRPSRRDERLAQALRANLGRRKAQARQRADNAPPDLGEEAIKPPRA